MGLLSLFSSRKGTDPAPGRGRRTRSDAGAGIASSRRLAEEYADDTLDPDFPQKQRARRRLIGAVVLLVAAVIVLPIVFEHKPRPVSEDVAVKVANGQGVSQKPKVEARKADPLPPAQNPSRNDAALDAGEELVSAPAAATSDKPRADAKADAKPDAKADAKVADAKQDKADKATGSGKYLILIGAFSSEERAKNWLAKLKASKVPAYLEKKVLADGERILLRAGPFADRDAADAADKRVKAVGLTSKVVEQ
ncbi:SPOR domain-containing protein [Cupriavidus sp. RAF12]|uniref:SPOR domain-containing protein n=1 Tax=Cupriavidus sp. RAF12 TaxID=3233050 RepID=UPI003F9087A7